MPNWCNNVLILEGEHEELIKFYNDNKKIEDEILKSELSLDKSVPMPENIYRGNLTTEQKNSIENWYNWSLSNWGTKWDATDVFIEDKENIINNKLNKMKYYFLTAWSPPIQWFSSIIQIYKNIKFEFDFIEEGMDFAGKIIVENGNVVFEEEYSPSSKYWEEYDKEKLINYIKEYLNKEEIKNNIEKFDNELFLENLYDNFDNDSYLFESYEDEILNILNIEKEIVEKKNTKSILNFFDKGEKIKKLKIQ